MLPLVLKGRAGLVLLERQVLDTARRYLMPPEVRTEAGGILLGTYRGEHLDITAATTPMRQDRRTRLMFDRRDPGHARAAAAAWRTSGRTVTYIGEWHSHTTGDGEPSAIDLATWHDVLAANPSAAHLFMIVAPAGSRFIEGCGDCLAEVRPVAGIGH